MQFVAISMPTTACTIHLTDKSFVSVLMLLVIRHFALWPGFFRKVD